MSNAAYMQIKVVGHITQDRILTPGAPEIRLPGGSAYYSSMALAALGLKVEVRTKLAQHDRGLVGELSGVGATVHVLPSAETTIFVNAYSGPELAERSQRVEAVAAPFDATDLGMPAEVIHLGPLTQQEMGPPIIAAARKLSRILTLDAQGLLRRVENGVVVPAPWPDLTVLSGLDILKVDEVEAERMVGEAEPELAARRLLDLGVREVLITFADRGSLLATSEGVHRLGVVPPPAIVDATGCGDTYLAGYVAERMRGRTPLEAAWFAASAASLKLAAHGPFRGDAAMVRRHRAGSSLELQ